MFLCLAMFPVLIPWIRGVPSPPPHFLDSWAARNGPWAKAQTRQALMAHGCGAIIEEEAPGQEDDDHASLKINYDDPATATQLAEMHVVAAGWQDRHKPFNSCGSLWMVWTGA